jgi:hypothetical protein
MDLINLLLKIQEELEFEKMAMDDKNCILVEDALRKSKKKWS